MLEPMIVLRDAESLTMSKYEGKLIKFIPSVSVKIKFDITERKGCGRVEKVQS